MNNLLYHVHINLIRNEPTTEATCENCGHEHRRWMVAAYVIKLLSRVGIRLPIFPVPAVDRWNVGSFRKLLKPTWNSNCTVIHHHRTRRDHAGNISATDWTLFRPFSVSKIYRKMGMKLRTSDGLDVQVPDIAGLVDAFRSIVVDAAEVGDFTDVLAWVPILCVCLIICLVTTLPALLTCSTRSVRGKYHGLVTSRQRADASHGKKPVL